jgi:protein tyrosine phosphatase
VFYIIELALLKHYVLFIFVFLQMPNAHRRYILAQGPLPHTTDHFWLMIWEQNCKAVVMLNRVIEKNQASLKLFPFFSKNEVFFLIATLCCLYYNEERAEYLRNTIVVGYDSINNFLLQIKCHQYWPLGHEGNKELHLPGVNLRVEHVTETQMDYYTTRILRYFVHKTPKQFVMTQCGLAG